MPHPNTVQPPPDLQNLNTDQLLAEMPFTWQPSVRSVIAANAIEGCLELDMPEDDQFGDFAERQFRYILPPDLSDDIWNLTVAAPGEIREAIIDTRSLGISEAFERDMIAAEYAMPQSAAWLVMSSVRTYPVEALAKALYADPERLQAYLQRFPDADVLMARLGDYIIQLDPPGDPVYGEVVIAAPVMRLTAVGSFIVEDKLRTIEKFSQ